MRCKEARRTKSETLPRHSRLTGMGIEELKKNAMMAHLIGALNEGRDIGHYGRLVFVMVARYFMSEDEIIELLTRDKDCDDAKARLLFEQVNARGYNPPKRERILEWMSKQEFPICPNPDDPQGCNIYKDLDLPKEVYDKIAGYYEHASQAA